MHSINQPTSIKLLKSTMKRINQSKYFFSTKIRTRPRNLSQEMLSVDKGLHS